MKRIKANGHNSSSYWVDFDPHLSKLFVVAFLDWSPKEKHYLAQELSDVLIYLVRLAEKFNVYLPKEVVAKIALNSKKYPKDLVKRSIKKYTEYKEINSLNN